MIGLLAAIGLIKVIEMNDLEPIFKFFSNPLVYTVLLFTPILVFFIQLENGNILIYDGTFDKTLGRFTIFLLFVVFNYSFFILMHERGKYQDNPNNFRPLLLLARKAPHFINYWIFVSISLNMLFSGRYFLRDSLFAFSPQSNPEQLTPITLQGGILIFSIFILIIQLFYSIIHYLVYREEIHDDKLVVVRNNVSLLKRIAFYAIFVFLLLVFAIQLIIIAAPLQTAQLENAFLFLQNPYFVSFDRMNEAPSSAHWFGTDQVGRDLFALIIFALSTFIVLVFIFSVVKFRISMDFMNVTSGNVTSCTKKEIFQIIGNIPIIPVLVLITVSLRFVENILLFQFLLILYLSSVLWTKVADLVERNNIHDNRERLSYLTHPIILHTMSSLMIDLTILSFWGPFSGSSITFGGIINDAIGNQPLINWWGWQIPLIILVLFISFLRSSKLRT